MMHSKSSDKKNRYLLKHAQTKTRRYITGIHKDINILQSLKEITTQHAKVLILIFLKAITKNIKDLKPKTMKIINNR